MQFSIRSAAPDDYAAMQAIFDEVDALHRENLPHIFRKPHGPVRPRDYFNQQVTADNIGFFVAEFADQLVGYVHIIITQSPPFPVFVPRKFAVVDTIAVTQAHQNLGIGRALMQTADDWARAQGAESIELNVYAFNTPAVSFYLDQGYTIQSHRMHKPLNP
ncbi:MAG: GNAT family N-acetyltransferase [Anaerolineae bacterium]|nr:GNAT family N-acetyltransferase [Anaerolineae bacterium]